MPRSTTGAHELGVTVGQWNALVRRARLDERQKLAALIVSSYADADGTGIHCGVARFSADLQCSYSTAQRYLRWLRAVGLIELTRPGNRRRRRSDEYRLILGPDVLEHLEVLDPARYDTLCGGIRDDRRRTSGPDQASARVTPDQQPVGVIQGDAQSESSGVIQSDAQSADTVTDQASSMVTPDNGDQASNGGSLGVTQDDAPPSLTTFPKRSTSPTTAEADLRTAVTVPSGTEPRTPDLSSRCQPHNLSGATRPDGRPACPLCRVEQDQAAGIRRPAPDSSPLAAVIPIRRQAS